MKREVSNGLAQRPYARHRLRMLGLTLTLAPFGIAGEALAICTPPSPPAGISGQTINCTGTTTNQQGSGLGYGSLNDDNNTYNIGTSVVPNASVTGTSTGFEVGTGYTI